MYTKIIQNVGADMQNLKILIATDLSDSTLGVISKTLDFAKKTDSEVDILHIVENGFFGGTKDIDAIHKNALEYLDKHIPEVDRSRMHVIEGVVKRDVALKSEEMGANLVVVGSSGESGLIEEFFLGSSTKEIVRSTKAPVLVVKNSNEIKVKKILAISDFSEASKEALEATSRLFPEASFTLYHSYTLPFESRLNVYGLDHSEAQEYQSSIVNATKDSANEFIRSLEGGDSRYRYVLKRDGIETHNFKDANECSTHDLVLIHTTVNFSFIAFDILEASKLDVLIISTQ
ncbi:MAG: universal stress protein [Campylobacterales bacterium]